MMCLLVGSSSPRPGKHPKNMNNYNTKEYLHLKKKPGGLNDLFFSLSPYFMS
jgi:hypothetical protein